MGAWWILASWLCLIVLLEPEVQCCEEGSLRLNASEELPSPAGNVGRLELCLGEEWGTIALREPTHFWSAKNIQVACEQLGFSGGLNSIPPSHIPDAAKSPTGLRVHLRNVACLGEESQLLNCEFNRESSDDTSPSLHQSDVFVVCRPRQGNYSDLHVAGKQIGDIRLFGDVRSGHGAVQIFTSVGWTGICPDGWTNSYARIVCQALGYDSGFSRTVSISNATVSRLVFDANCSNSLTTPPSSRVQGGACSFQMVAQPDDCLASEDSFAGVNCGVKETSSQHPVRFFGHGRFDSSRAVGVVEIFMDQRWGMVCDREPENISQINANVLCEQFFANPSTPSIEGETVRIAVPSLRLHQSHLKPMWSNGLVCPTSASDVNDCVFEEPLGFSDCSSGHILALDCGSSVVPREDNMTAIIVGIVVTIFIFVLAVLIFAKVFFTIFKRRRRDIVAVNTSSYALSLPEAGPQLQHNPAAAINVFYDEDKFSDDVGGQGKEGVGQSKETFDQQDHKLTG